MKNIIIYIKLILVIVFLLPINNTKCQEIPINLEATIRKNIDGFTKGEKVKFTMLTLDTDSCDEYGVIEIRQYLTDTEQRKLNITNKLESHCHFNTSSIQEIWNSYIITHLLRTLQKKGFQHELRKEMEEDALQYIAEVKQNGIDFYDPLLENYIYGLIAKISPKPCIDGRLDDLNILIIQDPTINASTFPNGTIVINTGLLACIHTEDELVAVLSHEIAHYVLDHGIQNVNKSISRTKRAEFWSTLAVTTSAITESIITSKKSNYIPGIATLGVATLSSALSSQVINRLGMKYDEEQENQADQIAFKILKVLGYDTDALSSVLLRIERASQSKRSNALNWDWETESLTHSKMTKRRCYNKFVECKRNNHFEKMMSFAITNIASMMYYDNKFNLCSDLIDQNIDNHVATANDYILKANCIMKLHNTDYSNEQVAKLIAKAKETDPTCMKALKTEILLNLRNEQYAKAKDLIITYLENLKQMNLSPSLTNANNSFYISQELLWTKDMLIKLKGIE